MTQELKDAFDSMLEELSDYDDNQIISNSDSYHPDFVLPTIEALEPFF